MEKEPGLLTLARMQLKLKFYHLLRNFFPQIITHQWETGKSLLISRKHKLMKELLWESIMKHKFGLIKLYLFTKTLTSDDELSQEADIQTDN